ncbi:MAG: hypothetical protein ABI402_07500 [Ferruginibacter sp.]
MSSNNLIIQNILDNNDIVSLQESELHEKLSAYINSLILKNFDELIYVLYRVDVSEHKLKTLLKENSKTDAGSMIATLIIERQIQKIKSREEHRRDNNIIDDEESW